MGNLTANSGKTFDYRNPEFDLRDMASALSKIARFNGHCDEHWSVAQHLLCCSEIAPNGYKLEALMHDAHEAYVCDVPTPLKLLLPDYTAMERSIETALRKSMDMPTAMSPEVIYVDATMLIAEAFVFHHKLWEELGSKEPSHFAIRAIEKIQYVSQADIAQSYLFRWEKLLAWQGEEP